MLNTLTSLAAPTAADLKAYASAADPYIVEMLQEAPETSPIGIQGARGTVQKRYQKSKGGFLSTAESVVRDPCPLKCSRRRLWPQRRVQLASRGREGRFKNGIRNRKGDS